MNAQVNTKVEDNNNKVASKGIPAEVEALPTKSAKIRKLNELGWTRSEIAKGLGLIYQHVRNVLTQPLKRKTA